MLLVLISIPTPPLMNHIKTMLCGSFIQDGVLAGIITGADLVGLLAESPKTEGKDD